ncbi:hypothetical protein [Halobaculum sp. EA56]|uniref:hypothetical protein n=1 Tax=Halobaculum sp. EA56 TaxID=3421648 RepID=UPI003EB8181C
MSGPDEHSHRPDVLDEDDTADGSDPPDPPEDAPAYVVDPLRRQSPERLRAIAEWAARLASHKAARGVDATERDPDRQRRLRERVRASGHSANPDDYDGVPERAYVSVKEPQEGYEYAYWQWRSEGADAPDRNEAIGPLRE